MQVFNSPDKVFHVNENDDSEFIVAKLYVSEAQPYVMFLCKVSTRFYRWKGGKKYIYEWGTSTSKISAIKRFYNANSNFNHKIEFYIINNLEDLIKVMGVNYV